MAVRHPNRGLWEIMKEKYDDWQIERGKFGGKIYNRQIEFDVLGLMAQKDLNSNIAKGHAKMKGYHFKQMFTKEELLSKGIDRHMKSKHNLSLKKKKNQDSGTIAHVLEMVTNIIGLSHDNFTINMVQIGRMSSVSSNTAQHLESAGITMRDIKATTLRSRSNSVSFDDGWNIVDGLGDRQNGSNGSNGSNETRDDYNNNNNNSNVDDITLDGTPRMADDVNVSNNKFFDVIRMHSSSYMSTVATPATPTIHENDGNMTFNDNFGDDYKMRDTARSESGVDPVVTLPFKLTHSASRHARNMNVVTSANDFRQHHIASKHYSQDSNFQDYSHVLMSNFENADKIIVYKLINVAQSLQQSTTEDDSSSDDNENKENNSNDDKSTKKSSKKSISKHTIYIDESREDKELIDDSDHALLMLIQSNIIHQSYKMPHWGLYVGWVVGSIWILFCSAVIVIYGINFDLQSDWESGASSQHTYIYNDTNYNCSEKYISSQYRSAQTDRLTGDLSDGVADIGSGIATSADSTWRDVDDSTSWLVSFFVTFLISITVWTPLSTVMIALGKYIMYMTVWKDFHKPNSYYMHCVPDLTLGYAIQYENCRVLRFNVDNIYQTEEDVWRGIDQEIGVKALCQYPMWVLQHPYVVRLKQFLNR